MSHRRKFNTVVVPLVAAILTTACGRTPDVKADTHLSPNLDGFAWIYQSNLDIAYKLDFPANFPTYPMASVYVFTSHAHTYANLICDAAGGIRWQTDLCIDNSGLNSKGFSVDLWPVPKTIKSIKISFPDRSTANAPIATTPDYVPANFAVWFGPTNQEKRRPTLVTELPHAW